MSYVRGGGVQHWHTLHSLMTMPPWVTAGSTGGTYPTADLAIYVPILVERRVVVVKLAASNGSAVSGNIDVGLYDAAGTKLASSGTTAQSGTSTEQVFDITDTTIGPGLYYLAVTLDNTTGLLFRGSPAAPLSAALGVRTEQLGAGAALPSTATWTVPQTLAYIPVLAAMLEGTIA